MFYLTCHSNFLCDSWKMGPADNTCFKWLTVNYPCILLPFLNNIRRILPYYLDIDNQFCFICSINQHMYNATSIYAAMDIYKSALILPSAKNIDGHGTRWPVTIILLWCPQDDTSSSQKHNRHWHLCSFSRFLHGCLSTGWHGMNLQITYLRLYTSFILRFHLMNDPSPQRENMSDIMVVH